MIWQGATRDESADNFRSVRQWHDEDSLALELLQLAHRQATTDPTTTHYCTTIERFNIPGDVKTFSRT
jgi:hypothetical protein